jgi:hypothetical protein
MFKKDLEGKCTDQKRRFFNELSTMNLSSRSTSKYFVFGRTMCVIVVDFLRLSQTCYSTTVRQCRSTAWCFTVVCYSGMKQHWHQRNAKILWKRVSPLQYCSSRLCARSCPSVRLYAISYDERRHQNKTKEITFDAEQKQTQC